MFRLGAGMGTVQSSISNSDYQYNSFGIPINDYALESSNTNYFNSEYTGCNDGMENYVTQVGLMR